MTTAERLHDSRMIPEEVVSGSVRYEPQTGIYTFPDGSCAKLITRYVDCPAYQSAALSTMSKKPVKYWMKI